MAFTVSESYVRASQKTAKKAKERHARLKTENPKAHAYIKKLIAARRATALTFAKKHLLFQGSLAELREEKSGTHRNMGRPAVRFLFPTQTNHGSLPRDSSENKMPIRRTPAFDVSDAQHSKLCEIQERLSEKGWVTITLGAWFRRHEEDFLAIHFPPRYAQGIPKVLIVSPTPAGNIVVRGNKDKSVYVWSPIYKMLGSSFKGGRVLWRKRLIHDWVEYLDDTAKEELHYLMR